MKLVRRAAAPLFGSLLCVALPAPLHAQSPTDAAAAEALFAEGRKAMARGDAATACAKFEASQRLDPGVGTLFNLADCKEALGDLAAAWVHLREAEEDLASRHYDDRIEFARKRLAEIEQRLPRLRVRLALNAPADTRVLRNGALLPPGSLGSALPVNPGEHVLEISAPGHETRRLRVVLAEGKVVDIAVGPGAPTGAQRTWGWVTLGVGAAGVAGGAITGAVALSKDGSLDAACAPPDGTGARACAPPLQGDLDTLRVTRTLSYIGFGVGVVGVGLGMTLLLTAPESGGAGAEGALRLTPVISPGYAGVQGLF